MGNYVGFAIWLAILIATSYMAHHKRRSPVGWTAIAFFTAAFGSILLTLVMSNPTAPPLSFVTGLVVGLLLYLLPLLIVTVLPAKAKKQTA